MSPLRKAVWFPIYLLIITPLLWIPTAILWGVVKANGESKRGVKKAWTGKSEMDVFYK